MSEEKKVTVYIHVGDDSDEDRQGDDSIDVIDMGSGADTGNAGRNYNIILGGSGADNITADGIWEDVFGGSGDDTITVTGRNAWVYGGTGADTIYGGESWDLIYGGEGADTIYGGGGADWIYGGAGDDSLTGGSGADVFFFSEGHGTDTIQDFNAADGDKIHLLGFEKTITWAQLSGKITEVKDENEVVTGVQIDLSDWGGGTIILNGITSVSNVTEDMFYLNVLVGEDDSDDTLFGDGGDDTLTGGTGADIFKFGEGGGDDTITDFNAAEGDKIDLRWFEASITWEQLSTRITEVKDEHDNVTGVKIDLSDFGGGTITLTGITSVSDVTEDMFTMAAHRKLHSEKSMMGIRGTVNHRKSAIYGRIGPRRIRFRRHCRGAVPGGRNSAARLRLVRPG